MPNGGGPATQNGKAVLTWNATRHGISSPKPVVPGLERAYAGLSAEEKDTVDLSAQDVWDERMHEAGLANDPVTFRTALDGWTRAVLEAMERSRIKGGAA